MLVKILFLVTIIAVIWAFIMSGALAWFVAMVVIGLIGHSKWGDPGDPNDSIFDHDKNSDNGKNSGKK